MLRRSSKMRKVRRSLYQAASRRRPGVLLAGNFLSPLGLNRAPIEDLAEKLRSEGFPVTTTSEYRNGMMRAADLIWTAVVAKNDYDVGVVDLYSGKAFLWGDALSRTLQLIGHPFIICLHGGALPDYSRMYPERVRKCLRRADFVTAPSAYLVEQMRPYRSDVVLLPNPLNVGAYPYVWRRQPSSRLVWLRSFRHIYNPMLAPKVVSVLAQRGIHADLTMIGSDWGDGTFRRTQSVTAELGLSERISFPGPVPRAKVPQVLNQADIFLNTTNVDNNPVSVAEAMACGLCIVSTDVGGMSYLLDHEVNGLLAPPDNPEAMADAVQRILSDSDLAAKLSRNARRKAEGFDWEAVLPQWRDLLTSCPRMRHRHLV